MYVPATCSSSPQGTNICICIYIYTPYLYVYIHIYHISNNVTDDHGCVAEVLLKLSSIYFFV